MAAELWSEVTKDLDTFFPGANKETKAILAKLGEPTDKPETLLKPLLDLINNLAWGA